MPKTKRFIDKKKSVTFQLVHRSQQDPLVADETAPQRVLLQQESTKDKEKRLEEQHKYGIFFDDDYNYLQHLKDTKDRKVEWPEGVEDAIEEKRKENEQAKILLPSSVFASQIEEEIGMLNKAAPVSGPQLHLDPDLVAAMDDDFDYEDPENQLEDNFIELANGVASDEEDFFDENDEDNYVGSEFDDKEEGDEIGSLPSGSMKSYDDEETKSRFTNYSMTSSVIRRNDQLTLLDGRFEKMYADYDENEIGALDCEEIEGHLPESSDILLQFAEEFEKEQERKHLDKDVALKILGKLNKESDDENDDDMVYMKVQEKEKWDCETILSTYSNIYNHPKLISEEPKNTKLKISSKTGIPLDVLNSNKLTAKALKKLNEENGDFIERGPKSIGVQSVISQLSSLSVRPKDETPDDRKLRKKLLREYKKERRLEKKVNTIAFKEETKRQAKIAINNKNNVQGNKIL